MRAFRARSTVLRLLIAGPMLSAPATLGGCKKAEAITPVADIMATDHGFSPTSFKLPGGGPGSRTTVTFVRTTDRTCATEVVFPSLNIDKELPLNEVVSVDLPTDTPKTMTFQCGMGMYKGAVVVTAK
jgi:plastocyanin domain-containing protein